MKSTKSRCYVLIVLLKHIEISAWLLNRNRAPHYNHLPITSRCTHALGNTGVEGWTESSWPGSIWALRPPPNRPLIRLETLRDAFSIPHLPRDRPCPANRRHSNWCSGVGAATCLSWCKGNLAWLPSGEWLQLTLQTGGSWSVFICFPCSWGLGPTLGIWGGQSKAGISGMAGTGCGMYYLCLPLDDVLALLGYHQRSVQGIRASGCYLPGRP